MCDCPAPIGLTVVVEIVIAVLLSVKSAEGISVNPSIETVSPDLITKVSDPVTVN
jgi:hypothetical protein